MFIPNCFKTLKAEWNALNFSNEIGSLRWNFRCNKTDTLVAIGALNFAARDLAYLRKEDKQRKIEEIGRARDHLSITLQKRINYINKLGEIINSDESSSWEDIEEIKYFKDKEIKDLETVFKKNRLPLAFVISNENLNLEITERN